MKETIPLQQKMVERRAHKVKKGTKSGKKLTQKNTQQRRLGGMEKEAKRIQSEGEKCKAQHMEGIR